MNMPVNRRPVLVYDPESEKAQIARGLYSMVETADNKVSPTKDTYATVSQWVWGVDWMELNSQQQNLIKTTRKQLGSNGFVLSRKAQSSPSWELYAGPRWDIIRKFMVDNPEWGAPDGSPLRGLSRYLLGLMELKIQMETVGARGIRFSSKEMGLEYSSSMLQMLLEGGPLYWIPEMEEKKLRGMITYEDLMAGVVPDNLQA